MVILVLFAGAKVFASEVTDHPAQCFGKKIYPCSLRSLSGGLRFERAGMSYVLGSKSSIKFLMEDQIQILEGSLWVENSKDLQIFAHPHFGFGVSGEVFLQKNTDGTLLVRNLGGEVQFKSPYLFKQEALPVGFQNWYGRLNSQKQIDRGVFRAIEVAAFLKAWIPMSNLSVAEAKGRVLVWKESWSRAVEMSAQFYQEVVERRVASLEELDQQRARRQKAARDEQNKIRQLYRQKTGFSVDSH